MVKEAGEHEAEDKRRREEIERRNKLDNFCYTIEKQLSDNRDKIDPAMVSTLEGLIREGREAVEKQDDAKVQDVLARLEKEAHAMASKLYESAGGGPGAPGAPGGGDGGPAAGGRTDSGQKKDKDNVIDAEFEEAT
jgi:molecular chaperone DnaK